jgi:hypothetical protein
MPIWSASSSVSANASLHNDDLRERSHRRFGQCKRNSGETEPITSLSYGAFSEDGAHFVATDPSGRALLIGMRVAAFR